MMSELGGGDYAACSCRQGLGRTDDARPRCVEALRRSCNDWPVHVRACVAFVLESEQYDGRWTCPYFR
jgi:hypothetical protein